MMYTHIAIPYKTNINNARAPSVNALPNCRSAAKNVPAINKIVPNNCNIVVLLLLLVYDRYINKRLTMIHYFGIGTIIILLLMIFDAYTAPDEELKSRYPNGPATFMFFLSGLLMWPVIVLIMLHAIICGVDDA